MCCMRRRVVRGSSGDYIGGTRVRGLQGDSVSRTINDRFINRYMVYPNLKLLYSYILE